MGRTTGIAWTDATWNPWEGCQHAGPGCDACYAEARDQRWHGGSHFGPGAPRRRMVDATFRKPLAWSANRAWYEDHRRMNTAWTGQVPPLWVFCLSLGDFLDNAVDPAWRAEAWDIIRRSQHLRFQIVTKRIGNLAKMLPADWGPDYWHVGFIATVTDEAEFLRDGPKLKAAKRELGVRWVGLSVEPMLGPLRLGPDDDWLDWVIIGGESAQGRKRPRPFDLAHAALLLGDCQQAGVPCFVKQMGSNPVENMPDMSQPLSAGQVNAAMADAAFYRFRDHAGADISEWPEHLRVREMPKVYDLA